MTGLLLFVWVWGVGCGVAGGEDDMLVALGLAEHDQGGTLTQNVKNSNKNND